MGEGIRKTLNHRPTRIRRKLIILATEGKNKTETLYFTQLEKKQDKYHFIFASSNDTDPSGIINAAAKEARKQEISIKDGDFSAAVFDIDLDLNKINNIENTINFAKKKNVELYSSNPCFELWYLLHFAYSTKSYGSNLEVIKELRKYIPNYEKNRCDFNILDPLSYKAIANAKQMQKKVKEVNDGNICLVNNPNTDIYILVEKVLPELKKGGKGH